MLVKTTHRPEEEPGHGGPLLLLPPKSIRSVCILTPQPSNPAGNCAAGSQHHALVPNTPPTPLIPLNHSFLHSCVHHLFPALHTWSDASRCPMICDEWMDGWAYLEGCCSKPGRPTLICRALPIPSARSVSLYTKAFSKASESCPACEHPCPPPPARVSHTIEL